jgi:hypothetical protein
MMTRAKKTIFLYCTNENRRRELSFQLQTWGLAVLGGLSSLPPIPDAAVVVDDPIGAAEMVDAIADAHPGIPIVVLIRDVKHLPAGYPNAAHFVGIDAPAVMLLERVRHVLTQRRGRSIKLQEVLV